METLTLTEPDDWHVHLRDGDYLITTVPHTARQFARAIVMPNLKPAVVSVAEAINYRQRILNAIPKSHNFEPLMTLYLTDQTTPALIKEAKSSGLITACKLYPAGATTHSIQGVTELENIYSALEMMQTCDLPLLIHGEVTDKSIDVFDREKYFLSQHLTQLIKKFPQLRMVLEHVSTLEGVEFIKQAPKNTAATITVHHMLLNRNHLLVNGIHPHYYCLPVVKSEKDQEALIAAATSQNPKFFLGTDSAPHSQSSKESACGTAGIYTAHAALELCAEIFEKAKALDKLESFVSFHGADFYHLPRNTHRITLKKESWQVPETFAFGKAKLVPFRAGETISWKIVD